MKVKERSALGIVGKTIDLNIMDCYEASHILERIEHYLAVEDARAHGRMVATEGSLTEVTNIFELVRNFLKKISICPSEMPSIFHEEEDEKEEA